MTNPLAQDLGGVVLLPCPGCGCTATRVIGGPGTRGGPQYWAGCDHCRWRTWGDTEADAITAWNTRENSAEIAGALRDAERYRWLRTVTPYRFKKLQDACIADATDTAYFLGDKFDTAIDSAMQQGGGGGDSPPSDA